jgi:hypothetical protein
MSSRVVVLTDALRRKFHLAGDRRDIRGWATAFGCATDPRGLPALVARVYRDDGGGRYPDRTSDPIRSRDPFRAMLVAEDTAVEALRHSYASSAATAGRQPKRSALHGIPPPAPICCCITGLYWTTSVVRGRPTAAGPDVVDGAVIAGADQNRQGW